ncbi:hypothetical protein F7725_026899, partial [Dissostichus mawsoni]
MSLWLISLALPKDTLASGMGIIVGWPFLEKAVLQKDRKQLQAGLLVVEAQSVEQLVLDGVMVNTSAAGQRHHLLSTTTADVGPAAGGGVRKALVSNSTTLLFSHPFWDSICSHSWSLLTLGLKRMQETEEKDSSPRPRLVQGSAFLSASLSMAMSNSVRMGSLSERTETHHTAAQTPAEEILIEDEEHG